MADMSTGEQVREAASRRRIVVGVDRSHSARIALDMRHAEPARTAP